MAPIQANWDRVHARKLSGNCCAETKGRLATYIDERLVGTPVVPSSNRSTSTTNRLTGAHTT